MKNNKGFTMVEMLVTMSVFLMVLIPTYMMIFHYGDMFKSENARIKLQQESRFMLTNFTTELKSAGSVLTLANSGYFLKKAPYFNGIIPLNNSDYPDGLIMAIGDPDAVTKLTTPFGPKDGDTVLQVEDTVLPPGAREWDCGDVGIVIGLEGYYVFMVDCESADPIDPTSITIRGSSEGGPVYFSGLLSTIADMDLATTYDDPELGDKGDEVEYPKDAPVIRLSSFAIYLFKTVFDPDRGMDVRQFIRVTDTKGEKDILDEGKQGVISYSVISENIYDLQISYTAYPQFPLATPVNTYFSGTTGSSIVIQDLLDDIRNKHLKEIRISMVAISNKLGGATHENASRTELERTKVKRFADLISNYELPEAKLTYRLYSFLLELRNYNIIKNL